MTTDTEALRAQFEKLLSDSGRACLYEGDGQYAYPHDFAWLCYQAGHAAGVAAERKRCATMHESIEAAVKAVDMGFEPNEILDENSPIMQAFRYAIRAGDGEASND